ncbi:STAS domain-containing protein [Sorangium sp. So ce1182]|uniref:STAS domain-containing protein n=1 Tax=Sorangium sp. So ce1182 TaxID=3133334 RepID=UPI003F5F8B1B
MSRGSAALAALLGVIDELRDGVLVYDPAGELAFANARVEELLGEAPAGPEALAIGKGALVSGHPLEPLGRAWPDVLGGARKRLACRAPRAGGRPLDLEVLARRVSAAGEALILVELRDVTPQKQAERALLESKRQAERAVLARTEELQRKIRLVEEQERALLELSTPVIQVWEGVLVLPLVGGIDRRRSSQILDSLLGSIVETASDRVILDVTGVSMVDESVSGYLLKTVRAARLLGASCSLVGIPPAMARSLTTLGLDWSAVETFRNLRAGLEAAIRVQQRARSRLAAQRGPGLASPAG